MSTGMGSNSSSLPFFPPDKRKESVVKEEQVRQKRKEEMVNSEGEDKPGKKVVCMEIKKKKRQMM